jgi:hypothetical protein
MHDTPRERASVRRTMLRLLLLASFCLALGTAERADAADAPREVHGMSDAIATPDVALAWGILRGTSEATTAVVVRIVTDPAKYGWMGVVGIDPFSKQEQPLRAVAANPGTTDVRSPRSRFADFPRTEFRLFDSEVAARSGAPALVVFYLGAPDTTPEFANEDKLQAYLADRIARLRSGAGSKTP